jgi:broad specificity phosphatase PhoE
MWRVTGLEPEADSASPGTLPWDEIITSPLQRCRAFAEALASRAGIPVVIEPDWQEINYGDWDGMPLSEWRESAADQFREFRKDMTTLHPPNGEAFTVFRDRVLAAWQHVLDKPEGSRVLVVTHGGVMRVVLPTVLGIPLNRTGVLDIPFACLSRVQITQRDGRLFSILQGHNLGNN